MGIPPAEFNWQISRVLYVELLAKILDPMEKDHPTTRAR